MSTDAVWYLQEDTERIAPQTVAQLCTRLESGQLSPDAYVQHIKLPTWVPVAAVKGLAEVVAARRAAVETKRPTPTADTPWMITVDGRQDGPMSRADLARRARRGLVDKDTLVWREGMEGWVALSSVPALVRVLPGIESITETGQVRVVDRAQAKARLRKATPRTLDDCRRFLERTAGHEPTLRVLENMVRTGRNALGAVELLEEVLAPRDGWQRLMGIWRNLLRVVRQPDERTNLRMRMGQAAEGPLDVPAKALTIFTSALRESPRRTDVQAALRRLSDRLDARDATLEFVDTQCDAREGADRAALARFGGDLHLDWRDDVAAAAARYAVAARLDPNAATLDRLETLLERLDDWRPWTEALRAAADGVSAEDRVPYLHRLANAWQVRLERPARALGIYREILQVAPDDLQAMDALRRMHQRGIEPMAVHVELRQLFEGRRDFKALRDLDTAHLPHSAPGDERAAVLLRLASLARDQLSDPRAALDHLAHAVAQAPADEAIRAAYVEQAAALGVVEDAVATLEGLQGEHPSLSASLARSLFGVHRERTGNPTAARKWGRIAVNQGTPADRLALLPNLSEHPLVHRLALELLVTDPPAGWDRNRGRLMLAKTMAEDEAPEAVALYRAILADDATHVAALTALAIIYARDERWDDWFAARQALADGYVDENARIDVWRHSARRAAELSRQDDAAELWRRVLSARADDAEALDGLEQANAARGDWDGVADVLERRRAALDEADGLWITRRLAEVYADRLDDAARAAACWRAVVRIRPDDVDARRSLARLVTGAEAIGLWTAIFNADPRDAEAADALATLHRTDGAIREAFDVQLRHADSFEDDAEAVQRLKAVVAASAKEQVDLGPTPFQRILARTPNDVDASDGLARVYAQQEDWTALAASLRERAERATDVATRQALSRQLAAVQAENLGDPSAAFETLLAVFDSAPDDGLGPDLARLAAMSAGWSALLSAWTAAIVALPVSVATPLHRRLARWYMGPQDDPAAAATHLGAVLAQRPDDAEAVAALEALFADGRVRGQIIELLEPVYMRTQRQAELVEMLADTLPTGPERVPALRRLGKLYDGLDRGREALDAFGQALETSPQDAELRADVTRVGQRLDRQDLVADVLGRALLNAERPADVVALGEQLAPLLEGLGQRARATAVLQRILDADPRSAMALAALDAAATANGDLEAICDLLERRIEVAEIDDRVELRVRLADTWLRRDRVDAAIGVWQSARADRPDSIEPLVALDELYTRSDDWEAVFEVRLARASLAPDDERAVLVESLVPIADTHGDAEIQLDLRRRLVDLAPTPERIDSLQEQLLAEERWADLESLATARLAVSEDTSRWFATLAKAQSAQGRTLEALESWRQVLDRAPADVDALQAAHALYVQRDEPAGQAQTALDLAKALPEDDVRAPSLARLAAGLYEELGQGADAVRSWAQVRVVSPDAEDAIEALTGHFTESGAWARLRDLLRSVLSRARSSDARLALHLQIAELSVERLDDQQSAREAYETALAESPGSPRATVALGRLYQETGDWSAWVELAMARLGDVQQPGARREIYAEAAEVLTDRLDSPAHAFALLLKAVIEQPDDVLGPRVEALAKTLDRFPEAAHAYETALKEARQPHR
ncbi:MAG: tetratricopeptide (TPR) repeat protein, partial [Bradymonadia bacterium]